MKLTTRRLMIGVAGLAVVLALLAWADRKWQEMFPRSVERWARNELRRYELRRQQEREGIFENEGSRLGLENERLIQQYRDLAEAFERLNEPPDEWTYNGPYTDILPAGQPVTIRPQTTAKLVQDGQSEVEDEGWTVAEGTRGIVVHDSAWDEDSCYNLRDIIVRIVDGPHASRVGRIERVYLKRRP
jgi:hypothetical protein